MNARVASTNRTVQEERALETHDTKGCTDQDKDKKGEGAIVQGTLKNEKWVREFELEVTNTGDKPIYFLFLDLIADVKLDRKSPGVLPGIRKG